MILVFILGCASETERILSVSDETISQNRRSLTPILFEALLFLKVNKSYRDQNTAVEAMKKIRSDNVKARMDLDQDHI